jgi:DNA helicase IV
MAETKVSIDGLANAINQELKLYSDNIMRGIRQQTDKSMRQLVQETKATAPVGHRKKHYKNSITSKTTKSSALEYEKQWYVRGSDYRLSHLLNNGHALRDGGRYPGTQFITKAEVSIVKDYEDAIKEIIENG